ncbi:HNH endonuclease signature motif containing protein [Halostella salina]|uniref:HNH endonuclease signature motif containing protein n=1 Tax=Halostella salina TaxID=1547897 RepID=UPI0013CEEF86|nr:HNH endonuclease signature motif containing protein [Halostella salina]
MSISTRTAKKLWNAAGNECAHPECDHELIDFDSDSIVGEMCHIKARNPDGPRYDPEMSDDERNAYSNLILLCPTHHRIVDESPNQYPTELLREWKQEHEQGDGDTPELSTEQVEEMLSELQPEMLLVHVEEDDLEILRDVMDWQPSRTYPGKEDEFGMYPVVVSFDDLKDLLGRISALYRQEWNGEPMYRQSSDWTEEEVIAASTTAAHITRTALQYHQVEGSRRESEIIDSL